MSDSRLPLPPAHVNFLERVVSRENNDCVAVRQAFHDWESSLGELIRRRGECACELSNLPGLRADQRYSVKVTMTNCWLGNPSLVSLNGDIDSSLTPRKCREKNLTYASPMYAAFTVETEEPSPRGTSYKTTKEERVYLGTVPVMVDLDRHPSPELAIDRGGMFLSRGKEKVIPYFKDTDDKSTVAYKGGDDGSQTHLSIRSGVKDNRIASTRVTHDPEKGILVCFKGSRRSSPLHLLRALGVHEPETTLRSAFTEEEAAFFDSAFCNAGEEVEGSQGDSDDDEDSHLCNLFPGTAAHLKADALISSFRMLVYMRSHFLTDRDSLQTQTLKGCREILTDVFLKGVSATMSKLKTTLDTKLNKLYRARDQNPNSRASVPDTVFVKRHLMRFNNISPRLHYFIATGNVSSDESNGRSLAGACQLLERTSRLQTQTFFHKVVNPLDANSAPPCTRDFRLDSLGILDPVSTPEGRRTGLVNQLCVGSSVSRDHPGAINVILDMISHLTERNGSNTCLAGVWVSGRYVGATAHPARVARVVRHARRSGNIPRDIGVSVYGNVFVEIRLHSGRVLRPYFPLDKSYFDATKDVTFSSLIAKGHLCTIDLREASGLVIAKHDAVAEDHHAFRELPPSCSLGPVSSTIPYLSMEPAPRASYQSSMAQQSIGFAEKHYTPGRWDTKCFGLHYPQRPLVSTSYERNSGAHEECPVGCNVIIAILPDDNQEDALTWCKDSLERGLMLATQWKVKTIFTGARHFRKYFAHPDPDNPDMPAHLAKLDPATGIVRIGSIVRKGDALCGLGSSRGVSITKYEHALPATIEDIIIFDDCDDATRTLKIKYRIPLPVNEGDKFASRYSQKGVVSSMKRRAEMPFDQDGTPVDLLVHPAFMRK